MRKMTSLILLCLFSALSGFSNAQAESARPIPLRADTDWREIVEQRQQAFLDNPKSATFAKREFAPQLLVPLKSHNEAEPVSGMITEWWCSSNGDADYWDDMWMALIAETVKTGAKAYVYLYSYLGDDDATTLKVCSDMLEAREGIAMGRSSGFRTLRQMHSGCEISDHFLLPIR